MKTVLLEKPLRYDGLQLATAFFDRHAPGEADAMVLFSGEADVPVEHLVDQDDAEAGAFIYSELMAHVLLEHRGLALAEAVWRQRVLARLAADWIAARSGVPVAVRGNDLFARDGKLSVSVAASSPRGCLLHFGVNVEAQGAPVRATGLRDLRVNAREYLAALARLYAQELAGAAHAAGKVRPVP